MSVSGANGWQRSTTTPHSGTYCARAQQTSTPAQDHYLITPPINFSSFYHDTLKFYLYGGTVSGNDLYVLAGKSNNSINDFTDTLAVFKVGINMPTTYTLQSIGLPNYRDTVFIAFRMFYGTGSLIYLDDIIIKADSLIVPVELTNFTANVNNNNVTLNWSTASETNNKGFEIQRNQKSNVNGEAVWNTIGFVEGKGTTTEIQNYYFKDKEVEAGKYSYRLKQIDFDGAYEYSNEIEIIVGLPDEYSLEQNYPNPFNPSTKISWQTPVGSWQTLKVYNVLGNEVVTLVNEYKQAGSYEIEFDASNLSSGVYFYKLEAGQYSATKKMTILK